MNRILILIAIIFGTLFSGCSSWNDVLTNETKLESICNTTQGVAQTTVSLVIAKNPDLKEWFLLSSNIIQVAVNDGTIKPTEIMSKIDEALIEAKLNDEVRTSVEASINTILTLYSTVYTINIEGNMDSITKAYIKILRSACIGIDSACGKLTASSSVIIKYKSVDEYTLAELRLK